MYLVIWLPPLGGAVQLTVAEPLPATAVTSVGADGAVVLVGMTAFDGSEAGPGPAASDAVTVKV